jgi:hypothetical protein
LSWASGRRSAERGSGHSLLVVAQPARILAANGRLQGRMAVSRPSIRREGWECPCDPTPWAYDGVPGEGSIPAPLPPPYDIDFIYIFMIFGIKPPDKPRSGPCHKTPCPANSAGRPALGDWDGLGPGTSHRAGRQDGSRAACATSRSPSCFIEYILLSSASLGSQTTRPRPPCKCFGSHDRDV